MKALFVMGVMFLFVTAGCSKNHYTAGESDPWEYDIHFEFMHGNDSSYFKQGDIELSGIVKSVNLQTDETFVYEDASFYPLPVDSIASNIENRQLFGPFTFAKGWETEEEAGGHGNVFYFDRYFLLRYKGTGIDTLRVRENIKVGYYKHFSFYIDGSEQEIFGKTTEKWRQSDLEYLHIQKHSSL